ncbi:hypothetical protein B0H14DRAFT_2637013 [Mycena olivaceomarginata]|nr:hypothetical protein B0H14DRAFT_2637013 [Mycena olivaceomarginata]
MKGVSVTTAPEINVDDWLDPILQEIAASAAPSASRRACSRSPTRTASAAPARPRRPRGPSAAYAPHLPPPSHLPSSQSQSPAHVHAHPTQPPPPIFEFGVAPSRERGGAGAHEAPVPSSLAGAFGPMYAPHTTANPGSGPNSPFPGTPTSASASRSASVSASEDGGDGDHDGGEGEGKDGGSDSEDDSDDDLEPEFRATQNIAALGEQAVSRAVFELEDMAS